MDALRIFVFINVQVCVFFGIFFILYFHPVAVRPVVNAGRRILVDGRFKFAQILPSGNVVPYQNRRQMNVPVVRLAGFVDRIVVILRISRRIKAFFFAFEKAVVITGLCDLPRCGGLDVPGVGTTVASFFRGAIACLGVVFPYLRMADAVAVARFGGLYIIIYVAAGVCR